ncbi:hypothetical protein O9993_10585 [Vibrio lentus]|nr:hypothetical protein [Vibrio lentus]
MVKLIHASALNVCSGRSLKVRSLRLYCGLAGTEAVQALQAGAISTALPFATIILLLMCELTMGMRTEKR